MAFYFPLEVILRLRRGQERMERLKLEAIASELTLARNQLESMTQQFFESSLRFRQQMGQEMFASEVQFEDARSERVAAARRSLEMRIAEFEKARLKQVETYRKARQSREILENLRERKLALYLQWLSRREQQDLDDLFLTRRNQSRDE